MTKTMTLLGDPLSTNNIYRSHCRFGHPSVYMTPAGRALKESYRRQAMSQWEGKPAEGELGVSVTFFFKSGRRADIDNYSKILFDSMTGIAWLDDSQIRYASYEIRRDKSNPRIEVEILHD